MKLFSKYLKAVILCSVVGFCASCTNPKQDAVNRLRALFEDAKANSKTYTDEQWMIYLVEYQQVDSLLSEFVFSDNELAEISPMKGRCSAYALKAKAVRDSHQIDNALHDSRGVFKGFESGLK